MIRFDRTAAFLINIFALALLTTGSRLCRAAEETSSPAPNTPRYVWGSPVFDNTATDTSRPPIAVTGVVFADGNADGKRDDNEKGIAGAIVSDGLQVVRTGPDGAYGLPDAKPGVNRFVFVTVPSGYRLGTTFYREIPRESGDLKADFGLVADPQSTNPNHGFAHITDIHVSGKGRMDFMQMKDLPIAFIVATGDLTNNGRNPEEKTAYKDAIAKSPVPVMNLPGNHDLLENGSGPRALGPESGYEEILGPKYYSFDYGGRHYIMLNSTEDMPRQREWLRNDLALQPAEKELLVFQHFPPQDGQLEFLQKYNTRALFFGHKHANNVVRAGKILCVNTSTPGGTGLDFSPRTVRVITFKDSRIDIANYSLGYGNQAEIAQSPDLSTVAGNAPAIRLNHEWPMFKGDAARTGTARDIVKPPFVVAWRQSLPGTILMSSPVVGNGAVYIGLADSQNKETSGVYALDALTGKVQWHYSTTGKVAHAVALADGSVFAASHDGIIHAMDAKSGARRWSYSLGSPTENWVYTSPVVWSHRVFGGMGFHFVALDAASGTPLWRMPEVSAGFWCTYSSPALRDGKLLCVLPGLGAASFDALTGNRLWEGEKSIVVQASSGTTPAIGGTNAYVFGGGVLYALDMATGATRWTCKSKGGVPSPVATDTAVLLTVGNGTVVELDAATGKERWTYSAAATLRKTGKAKFYFDPLLMSTPVLSGGMVYLSTTDGQLLALDEATGAERYILELGLPFTSSPAISGNAIFLASYNGTLLALVSTAKEP
jgi:outer membrane protein assembly factor BamB/predicted phosphodiesterase